MTSYYKKSSSSIKKKAAKNIKLEKKLIKGIAERNKHVVIQLEINILPIEMRADNFLRATC